MTNPTRDLSWPHATPAKGYRGAAAPLTMGEAACALLAVRMLTTPTDVAHVYDSAMYPEVVLGQCPEWDVGCACPACGLPAGLPSTCPRCCTMLELPSAIQGCHAARMVVSLCQWGQVLATLGVGAW